MKPPESVEVTFDCFHCHAPQVVRFDYDERATKERGKPTYTTGERAVHCTVCGRLLAENRRVIHGRQ